MILDLLRKFIQNVLTFCKANLQNVKNILTFQIKHDVFDCRVGWHITIDTSSWQTSREDKQPHWQHSAVWQKVRVLMYRVITTSKQIKLKQKITSYFPAFLNFSLYTFHLPSTLQCITKTPPRLKFKSGLTSLYFISFNSLSLSLSP